MGEMRYVRIKNVTTGEKYYKALIHDPHHFYKPRRVCRKRFPTASAAAEYGRAVEARWKNLRETEARR